MVIGNKMGRASRLSKNFVQESLPLLNIVVILLQLVVIIL